MMDERDYKAMNEGLTFPDIRNKLTPIKNLIAMIENGLLIGTMDTMSVITSEVEQCKKSIEYLSNIDYGNE